MKKKSSQLLFILPVFCYKYKRFKKKNSLINNNYLNNKSNTNIKQKNMFPESNHDSCFQRINNSININFFKTTSDKKR